MVVYGVLAGIGLILLIASFVLDGILDGALDAGPDWLTGISIGGFIAVLGITGVFCTMSGLSAGLTAVIAIVAAIAAGALINFIAFKIIKTATAKATTSEDLVGLEGTSVLGAAAGALGEVMLSVNGHPMKVNGRCSVALKAGDRVRVTAAASITSVTVERVTV